MKQKAIICDLDGTLCLFEKENKELPHYRNPYDAGTCKNDLLNPVVNKILSYSKNILLVSGREDKYRDQTEEWLNKYGIIYEELYMRKSGDFRKDSIVKNEIYIDFIKDNWDIEFVLDDRDQVCKMWRGLGLVCLQVAEGNF